ncbi:MAG TPA: hypothetical protein VGT03_02480 [Candidatus Acidoferrales bacterium]|nr:hypothetical protein [Candidatus Acidoferrales bacterium]
MALAVMVGFALAQTFAPVQKTALSASAQKDLTSSKARYESQTDPVERAKALAKLGRAEIRAAREAADAGSLDAALQYLKDYSDQANAAHDALAKTRVNAEKHSGGFRQLQISVRESARAVRELAGQVPFAQRQPFDALQQNLEALDHRLILELFPRRPGHELEKEERQR